MVRFVDRRPRARRRLRAHGDRWPASAGRAYLARLLADGRSSTPPTLLLFFVALRTTSVAIGMFLAFMAPVWVAVLAPRVFRSRTEPVVYVALPVALAGLVGDPLAEPGRRGRARLDVGPVAGVAAGLRYACFQMTVKSLTNRGVGSRHDRRRRVVAQRRLPAAPGALADGRRRLPPDDTRLGRRPRPRRRLHRPRLHALDRGDGPRARAALVDPRLPRAGQRAALRLPAARREARRRRRSPAAPSSSPPACWSSGSASKEELVPTLNADAALAQPATSSVAADRPIGHEQSIGHAPGHVSDWSQRGIDPGERCASRSSPTEHRETRLSARRSRR